MVRLATVDGAAVTEDQSVPGVDAYTEDLSLLVRRFEEAENMTREARELSERDRDYYDGKQLTAAERAALRKRGQPEVVINRIKPKVEFMRGFERRMRSDPKAFPRNPQDEGVANAATDALRFVADQNDFDETRSSVYENMIVEGYGAAEVTVVPSAAGDYDVTITRVPWDRIFYDPHSRLPDFSDAKYLGIVIWMDKAEALELYGDRAEAIENTMTGAQGIDTYGDRPGCGVWTDNRRTRVRVVQIHYQREGEWMVATYTRGGFLVDPQVSPYIDSEGRSACPLIMRSAYIDRENNRYGHVRDLIDIQDEVNKRRSKALHLINVRQSYGNKRAVPDAKKARIELSKPDGHLEINEAAIFGQDFGILPTGDMAAAQFQMLQQSISEIELRGPNAAMSGKDPRSQSGRALQAQQQGGSIEIEPIIDDLRQWTRDIYEAVWLRVKQFWTAEKWVRVTDDERNIKWVGLNRPITVQDRLEQMPPEKQEEFVMQAAQAFGIAPDDPSLLEQQIGVDNDVSGLDVDIVIEEGPDLATLQSEQFEMLGNLAQAGIRIPPKAIVQASSIRNKDQILDEMEKGQQLPPEVQQQMQELQQQTQQLQQALQQAAAQREEMERRLADKEAEHQIKMYEAETKRMVAMRTDAPTPADPMTQHLDALRKAADIEKVQTDTEQTAIENALLLLQPTQPTFRGNISA